MRISKPLHLKRLLQLQDIATATFCYTLTQTVDWLLFGTPLTEVIYHLQLTPFVVLFAFVAALILQPRLNHKYLLGIIRYAGSYTAISMIGMLAVAYLVKFDDLSRYTVAAAGALTFSMLVVNRVFLKWWYFSIRQEDADNYLKVLVIGSGNRANRFMRNYRETSEWGIDYVGVLDPDENRVGMRVDGIEVLGTPDDIQRFVSSRVVDEIIVCLPRSMITNLQQMFDACTEQGISVKFLADLYNMPNSEISLETVGNSSMLTFDPVHRDLDNLIIKRLIELCLTVPAIILLLPFYALVALIVKLDSPGPAFFTQERVGLNKRVFRMIKFRSMYEDAEARMAEVEHLNEADGPIFKIADDPRITRVGRVLRRTSIDELPQLFNVLKGEMSLVGPRPMSLRDVEKFSLGVQRKRFSVRPGLACLREVSGRSRLTFNQWLELDLKYIDEWSLWLDFKILLRLIPSVLKGDGAS